MGKRRKNYLPTLILIVVLWGLLGVIVSQVEPELVKDILVPGLYLPFWLVFFPASFFMLAVVMGNSRRGLVMALGLTGFLILRVYQLGNLLNLLLIVGMVVAMDRYLEG